MGAIVSGKPFSEGVDGTDGRGMMEEEENLDNVAFLTDKSVDATMRIW